MWPIALAGLALGAAILVHFVDPNEEGNYPVCPWLALTGTYCPGCGTMRAVAALTHADIVGALQMNLLLMAFLPFLAWAWATWLYRAFRPPKRPPPVPRPLWLWLMLVGILGYWIVRNIPAVSFLAPGGVPAPLL
ncbi:DUF2752 domain-containing protein [Lipingzhangella sp. LS1_29]|uniref:DUF2752 domain-containing protein n=1 Tax=Lipingzhangella rawalii TaxID=2055835 RepID=A0ABU2H236_9ACTN|nr:DUF2752 domain-containing protein [Lipingzhangella rawalii]